MRQPVATLQELGPALTRCFRAPEGTAGSQITIRLSLNSSGGIIGRPMVTYSKLVGSPEDRLAFAQAALKAVMDCTPIAVTANFGASIAGRMLSIRFIGGPARSI